MKKCSRCQKEKSLSNFSPQNYWCKECRAENGKEIKRRYGIGGRTIATFGLKLALEVYDKAGRKCKICGEVNDLTIHHLDQQGRNFENRGLQPNNEIENLVVWCRRCHGSFHGKQSRGIKKSKKKVG